MRYYLATDYNEMVLKYYVVSCLSFYRVLCRYKNIGKTVFPFVIDSVACITQYVNKPKSKYKNKIWSYSYSILFSECI